MWVMASTWNDKSNLRHTWVGSVLLIEAILYLGGGEGGGEERERERPMNSRCNIGDY